ncbi:hypothetical protein D7030_04880 [Flavobacteriaceae bacterium AU392]|nr:hypothetical protein D1817_11355 [Flavobacteriaceae bacterium]RKM86010.1 hypothetical protein D7030_04880 [Flavobacteriaceae bacterium AU392]
MISPENIEIDSDLIKSCRVDLVDNYGGNGYTSIDHGIYDGKHVLIIQSWYLQATNYLDYTVVDANTFEVLYRTAPIQGHIPDVQNEEGDTAIQQYKNGKHILTHYIKGKANSKEVNGPKAFNIAIVPHLFASMDLKKGVNFKLRTLSLYDGNVAEPEFEVSGTKKVKDENGKTHTVWVVDNVHQRAPKGHPKEGVIVAKTSYLISKEAPYYLGMEMYQIKSKDDFTLQKGYTQKARSFNIVDKAPSGKDIVAFLKSNQ